MPPGLTEAAFQTETSKIYALMALQAIGYIGAILFLIVRSRTKIVETKSLKDIDTEQKREKAELDERAAREAADLEERRQLNEAFRSVIRLLDNKDKQLVTFADRETELRKANEEFQRSYIALTDVRTGQIDKMAEGIKQQNETNEVVRETVTKAESEIRAHVERSKPAIETVLELPTTLERIEGNLKQLEEQLKLLPNALRSELEPFKKIVEDLKTEVKELTDEAKRVTETILPLIALPQPPIIEAFGPTVTDLGKTQKVDTQGITPGTPPFTDGTIATNGEPIERLPQ